MMVGLGKVCGVSNNKELFAKDIVRTGMI